MNNSGLVIGNGFDLAHGLPTTYQDFLKFTDNYRNYLHDSYYEQMLEVKKLVDNNTWIRHFKRLYKCNGWIGFEREISNIIKVINEKIPQFEALKVNEGSCVKFNAAEQDALKDFDSGITKGIVMDKDFISKSKGRMLNDLDRLIRALEIYLSCFINQTSVNEISSDIKKLDIDKVLSFNYTNTYERIYASKTNRIEYDYIHGKAEQSNTLETNNMVLGIEEYLPKKKRNKEIEFIAFKKFYQRIHKQTGCKYKEWVDEIKDGYIEYYNRKYNAGENLLKSISSGSAMQYIQEEEYIKICEERCPEHNLYIFGHSLDETDGDVLRDLILNDNVHTIIFYKDKDVYGQQIANLVKVIGQDELIRRTGGKRKSIEFEQQKPMTPIEN